MGTFEKALHKFKADFLRYQKACENILKDRRNGTNPHGVSWDLCANADKEISGGSDLLATVASCRFLKKPTLRDSKTGALLPGRLLPRPQDEQSIGFGMENG